MHCTKQQPVDKASLGEDEALEKQMNLFRRFVVEPIDIKVSKLAK